MILFLPWVLSFLFHIVLTFGISLGIWCVLVADSNEDRKMNLRFWLTVAVWGVNCAFLFWVPVFIWL